MNISLLIFIQLFILIVSYQGYATEDNLNSTVLSSLPVILQEKVSIVLAEDSQALSFTPLAILPAKRPLSEADRIVLSHLGDTYMQYTVIDKKVHAVDKKSEGIDVHKIAKEFCCLYYNDIKRLEQTYLGFTLNQELLSSFDPFRACITTRMAEFPDIFTGHTAAIEEGLAKIQAYWLNPIDKETKQSIVEVFQYSYWTAIGFGDDYFDTFILQIGENKEEGGGCHEGVTARLIVYYLEMQMLNLM